MILLKIISLDSQLIRSSKLLGKASRVGERKLQPGSGRACICLQSSVLAPALQERQASPLLAIYNLCWFM